MITYRKIKSEMPPLDTQIVIRKSEYKIHNEARVEILLVNFASQEWYSEDLLSHGFDEWMLVNPEDEENHNG